MSTPGSPRWRVRWVLAAFLATVLVTRGLTTLLHIRGAGEAGGLIVAGVHLHHMVFGLSVLVVLTGAWMAGAAWASRGARRPWAPVLLGVAWALVLDELALIINLSDVYWAPLGDESLVALVLTGIALLVASVTFSDVADPAPSR